MSMTLYLHTADLGLHKSVGVMQKVTSKGAAATIAAVHRIQTCVTVSIVIHRLSSAMTRLCS